ncbi:STAS domain-containing protein [Mangrovihabitans endophyticus]|uniref:Anti-sigma factor antagonist n=1 Tax=Mangrovihabitans endophyticus TaxID=1751298 RepID=A0A8J3C1Y8_9ACTN|nr:STAS domain-containing protein [Mangrovihabitans endophyticus]GGK96729.1 hypothetical protein GCM10012284_33750 [Mangrovihabitans endophyticus]
MENPIESMFAADGTATVAVAGEIDFSNADELSREICGAVAEWSPLALVVDLGRATFMDSTGLGALIEGYRCADEAGARFSVVNMSDSFRRVLAVTGLSDFFCPVDAEPGPRPSLSEATGA